MLLFPAAGEATIVVRAPVERLVEVSHVVVHGVVREVNDATAGSADPIRTTIELEIFEVLKGLPREQATLRLSLPGGRQGARRMIIPGMPTFRPGDQVVLLLERTGRGYALAGLAQGVYKVETTSAGDIAVQDLRGLAVLKAATGGVDEHGLPQETRQDLAVLLDYMRTLCAAEWR